MRMRGARSKRSDDADVPFCSRLRAYPLQLPMRLRRVILSLDSVARIPQCLSAVAARARVARALGASVDLVTSLFVFASSQVSALPWCATHEDGKVMAIAPLDEGTRHVGLCMKRIVRQRRDWLSRSSSTEAVQNHHGRLSSHPERSPSIKTCRDGDSILQVREFDVPSRSVNPCSLFTEKRYCRNPASDP